MGEGKGFTVTFTDGLGTIAGVAGLVVLALVGFVVLVLGGVTGVITVGLGREP
jgi:hypothetical protein